VCSSDLVFANERAAEISGYSLSEIEKGLNILQFIAPEDRERGTKIIQRLLAGGGCVPAEYTFVRKDGTTFPALITAAPRISENKVTGLRGLVIDTTERKKVMNALRESEEKYRRQFEEALDAIFVADAETGILVDCNPAACELVGRAKSEIVGMHQRILHPPEKNEGEFSRTFKGHLGKKKGHVLETQVITKSGEIKDVAIKANIFTLGNKTLMQGSFRDITERKKAEATLRQSEERYRSLFENSIDGVMISQPDGSILSANPVACRMLGMSEEELKKAGREGIAIKDEKLITALQERERTGDMRADLTFRRKDGTTFVGEVSSGVFTDAEGIIKTSLIIRDVTERQKTEEALKQEREKLEAVTTSINAGLVIISKDYHILWENDFIRRYKGDVNGKLCYATLNALDAPCLDCGVAKIYAGKTTFDTHEYYSTTVDGKPYWVEIIASPIKDENGKVVAASELVVDITKRKLVKQELQVSDAKFRAITESAIDAIFMFDEEDTVTYWNPAAERIFGYTEKEIIGQKVNATLVPPCHRKDHLKLTSELGKVENKKNTGEIEFPALKKDGTEFSMELSMAPLQLEGKRYFVAIARDVTDRKKAEALLNRTMDQLVLVNEKVEVVGSLTRHDVRNKLSTMTGYAYLLKKKHADQADIIEGLSKMEQAVKDIVAIFDFAKMYEQLGVEELKYINAEKALNEAIALFSGSSSLEFINDCHGLSLLADSLLTQLFYNLIDNSLKHGEKVTKIRVHYEKADQDELIVVFEDDGVGISAENKPKLFKEGFSTSGTSGYGLFLMRKMINVYGWSIQENGEPGKGAKFTMTIPRINQNGKENFQIA